jgi:hypothetical protein
MIALLKMLDNQGSRKTADLDIFKYMQWQERRKELAEKKKEEEDKKKKEKEKQKAPTFSLAEGAFWLFALSPLVGNLMWHLENWLYQIK